MNSTTAILLILCLSEALLLAVIAAMFMYRQALNLRLKLKLLQGDNDTTLEQVQTDDYVQQYLQLQQNLTQTHVQNLEKQNAVDVASLDASGEIKSLKIRLIALESELLSVVDNTENDQYWPNIVQRYSALSPPAMENELLNNSESESLLALAEIGEPFADKMSEPENLNDTDIVTPAHGQNNYDFQFKDTATEELGRLRDVISRQFHSIDEFKKLIQELEARNSGTEKEDKDGFDTTLQSFKTKINMMEAEQEQLNMCIEIVENENVRLQQVIENLKSAYTENEHNNSEDDLSTKTESINPDERVETQNIVRSLVQTNKEQLQCINILEEEIRVMREQSSEEIDGVRPLAQNIHQEKVYLTKIDELKQKLGLKVSELDLLQADYEMIKQKYNSLIKKTTNSNGR